MGAGGCVLQRLTSISSLVEKDIPAVPRGPKSTARDFTQLAWSLPGTVPGGDPGVTVELK
jgi:hypothetical protein